MGSLLPFLSPREAKPLLGEAGNSEGEGLGEREKMGGVSRVALCAGSCQRDGATEEDRLQHTGLAGSA
jgi:hypothetical protein